MVIGHPLDSLKVRMQLGTTGSNALNVLYRGVGPPLITSGFISSISFSTYEASRRFLAARLPLVTHENGTTDFSNSNRSVHSDLPMPLSTSASIEKKQHLAVLFGGGFMSGLCVGILTCPISLIKVQQQTGGCGSSSASMLTCIRHLYVQNGRGLRGTRGFFRGLPPQLLQESVGRGIYFSLYESGKRLLCNYVQWQPSSSSSSSSSSSGSSSSSSSSRSNRSSHIGVGSINAKRRDETLMDRVVAAALSGCVSWLAIYPVDVIKSKLHADQCGKLYTTALDCAKQTWTSGGVAAFYRYKFKPKPEHKHKPVLRLSVSPPFCSAYSETQSKHLLIPSLPLSSSFSSPFAWMTCMARVCIYIIYIIYIFLFFFPHTSSMGVLQQPKSKRGATVTVARAAPVAGIVLPVYEYSLDFFAKVAH